MARCCWRWSPARTSQPGTRPGSWRIARKVAPDRVLSTVDPEARHTRKTNADKRDGYKAHIAAEPETGLVTECALTAATAPDGPTGVKLLATEPPGLEVLGGSPTTAPGRPARRCVPPVTPRRSSPSRSTARCRAGSPSTTSASTVRQAWSAARPA